MNATPQPSRRPLLVAATGTALLLVSMWFTHQGSLAPYSTGAFLGTLHLLLTTLPWIIGLWVAMAGYGWPIRRFLLRDVRFPLIAQLGAGLGVLLLLSWTTALCGLLNATGAWVILGVGGLLLIWQSTDPSQRHLWKEIVLPNIPWPAALAGIPLGAFLIAATCPPSTLWSIEAFGYDVLSYHLELPREWLTLGAMRGLHHNVYSYLPSLMESGYMLIGALRGSMYEGIYTAQLFHASLVMLAACAIGCITASFVGSFAGVVTAVTFLSLPWVLITGSMAYNEMAMLALGSVAFLLAVSGGSRVTGRAVVAGFLVGCATLAKLTAGPMIAVPVGLLLLINVSPRDKSEPHDRRIAWKPAALAALAGLLTLAPYFARNGCWTGNPVFPFATGILGKGHWNDEEARRWTSGHSFAASDTKPAEELPSRLTEWSRHWLFNAGYGTVGGTETRTSHQGPDYRNVASFHTQGGVPLLWIVAAAGAIVGLAGFNTRRLVIGLGATLFIQIGFWMTGTHLQSRFLIPSLIPGCVLAGLLTGLMARSNRRSTRAAAGVIGAGLPLSLAVLSVTILFTQTLSLPDGVRVRLADISDSLRPASERDKIDDERFAAGDHLINTLPRGSKVYLIADVSRLLYINREVVYHSAFDHDELGDLIRAAPNDPDRVIAMLAAQGITHIWVHWGELHRLHTTYGFDRDVTPRTLAPILERCRLIQPTDPAQLPQFGLYALP